MSLDDLALRLTRGNRKGGDWQQESETMIGLPRLRNIRKLLFDVVRRDVPGDFLETGVWKGGACIFARAVLNEADPTRKVWVCDSFQGLPPATHPKDTIDFHGIEALSISLEQVRENFRVYGLEDGVEFVPGWFKDTLPDLDVRLSVLRLDGDLYESTMDALVLYDRVSPGGYVIVDDYNLVPCADAIHEFRAEHKIESEMVWIDDHAVFWKV